MSARYDPSELYADDPTIRQGEDGNWYHYPNRFLLKLIFLIISLLILALGVVLIWDPAIRYFTGERSKVRVMEIIREEPGNVREIIRYRKEIPKGDHLTKFTYKVSLDDDNGESKIMTMAVGSLRNAYANVNDEFEVIYFADEDYCYGLLHHRTWSFGVGFLFVGGLLFFAAVPTLYMVGRPILIDPEAPPEKEDETKETSE